jgi:hypothetical protein
MAPIGDQPDIFGDRRMGRAGPLAIDDLMKIIRVADIGQGTRAPSSIDHRHLEREGWLQPISLE